MRMYFPKWAVSLLAMMSLSIFVVGCGSDSTGPGAPVATSVSIGPASPSLTALGATLQLSATVRDQSGNVMATATVTWSSSNPAVVSVTSSGLVTGLAVGNSVITASSGSAQQVATVSVSQLVSSVAVSPAETTIYQSETAQLQATAMDANLNPIPNTSVTWSSGNAAVATVDNSGLVTGVIAGTTTIAAAAGNTQGNAQVTVLPPPVAAVEVSPAQATVSPGGTVQLSAVTRDAAGNVLVGRQISWQSANSAIASVNSSGLVTGLAGGGPVAITATSEGQTGSAFVTVQPPITSVTLSGASRVKVGDNYTYTVTARLADGTVVNRPVTWGIRETNRATITQNGQLVPVSAGTITILVSIDGVVWEAAILAYDWQVLSGSSSSFLVLDADIEVTNKFGSSEYPELVLACSSTTGNFLAWVDLERFVTANGLVTYRFDQGQFVNQTWIEFDNFSALGHPGPTNLQTKNFAIAMAGARIFAFAFTEFQGPARATLFRVTGLNGLLPSLLNLCPSNSVVQGIPTPDQTAVLSEWRALRAESSVTTDLEQARGARLVTPGPANAAFPQIRIEATGTSEIRAVRRER